MNCQEINADAQDRRRSSYRQRCSNAMVFARKLTAAVMRDVPDGGRTPPEVLDSIERHARQDDDRAWQLPKGMDAHDFLGHLIARGALQQKDGSLDDRLSCPISSCRDYLVDKGRDEGKTYRAADL